MTCSFHAARVLKQHVWGLSYIDELLQIGINQDPSDTAESNGGSCERFFWAMQDANYNVLALVNATGMLTERYEYTPYGQRTVYKSAGSDDALAQSPIGTHSQAFVISSVDQPYGLCDVGHQGLLFDKEFGIYRVRVRDLKPDFGRWMQAIRAHHLFPNPAAIARRFGDILRHFSDKARQKSDTDATQLHRIGHVLPGDSRMSTASASTPRATRRETD